MERDKVVQILAQRRIVTALHSNLLTFVKNILKVGEEESTYCWNMEPWVTILVVAGIKRKLSRINTGSRAVNLNIYQ